MLCCCFLSVCLLISHFSPSFLSIHPHFSFPSLPPPYSWLTGGTTIGSGLTYLTGEGTGNLLLKKLKLKKGETAAVTTDSKDDGDKEKK